MCRKNAPNPPSRNSGLNGQTRRTSSPWLGGSETAKCDCSDKGQNSLSRRAQRIQDFVPSTPPSSTVVDDSFHLRRSFSSTALFPPAKRVLRLHQAQAVLTYDPLTSYHEPHEPHERDTPNRCDDIMSFPGMGGGLPGMPGGAGGNVDPNDPNAVQMVRGVPVGGADSQATASLPGPSSTLTWGMHSKKQ